jgi:hypothetical protein
MGKQKSAGRQAPAVRPEGGLNMGKPNTTEYYKISSRQARTWWQLAMSCRIAANSRVSELEIKGIKGQSECFYVSKSWAMGLPRNDGTMWHIHPHKSPGRILGATPIF